MRKILISLSAISLMACTHTLEREVLDPPVIANHIVLDEKAGIAVETMYTALVTAGALAFRAGVIAPSTNPDVKRASFCTLVLAGQFVPTDKGSQVSALECKLRDARDKTRIAYDALNGQAYDTYARLATTLGKELLVLLKGN